MINRLITLLRQNGNTLAIHNGETRTYTKRGISALYELISYEPDFLEGAIVADKVVGKGAAALLVLGGVKTLHAEVISEAAMTILKNYPVNVTYNKLVPQIQNRSKTGICPVETICKEAKSAVECLPLIKNFIESKQN